MEQSSNKLISFSFLHSYIAICQKKRVAENEYIKLAIKNAPVSSSGEGLFLNLCNITLSFDMAIVLSECLIADQTFDEISVADCMLSEEACCSLLDGLRMNAFCRKLILKGNNIRGKAVKKLGDYLSHNVTLKSLILEWNQLGMLEKSFAEFCEGLCQNHSLEMLDLRNNQLGHECASELAKVFKKNETLALIDLRWNTLGVLGSRQLLTALQKNRNLVRLDLTGNEVPQDIITAIDIATSHNAETGKEYGQQLEKASSLHRKLTEQDRYSKQQISKLMGQLDNAESQQYQQNKRNDHRVRQLQTLLEEKKHAFNQQLSKLSVVESHLAITESKYMELQKVMKTLVLEKDEILKYHSQQLKQEKNDALINETTLRKEIDNLKLKISQLQNQLEESDAKCHVLKNQNLDLQEEIANVHADVKLKHSQMEEKLQTEKMKYRDLLLDCETSKDKQLAKLRVELEAEVHAVKERLSRCEKDRSELDSEINRLKTQLQSEKLAAEESASALRNKLRVEEEQRTAGMDERLRSLQLSKDSLLKETHTQSARIGELERTNAALNAEMSAQRRKLEETQSELGGAKADSASAGARVRTELSDRMKLLEETDKSRQKQLEEVNETVQKLREDNASLREQLVGKDAALRRVREDEQARIGMLRTAVLQFCQDKPDTR